MDWDAAFNNRATVSNFAEYLERWETSAATFRDQLSSSGKANLDCSYGPRPRNRYDLFMPDAEPVGMVVFIHGGYWRSLEKSYWSHLANGCLKHGWAFAIPSYTLAPEARIAEITREIVSAVNQISSLNELPVRLVGHSAGGHLVARMLCSDVGLDGQITERIENTVAISGLFDLTNLYKTEMNDDLRIDEQEVETESPARLKPRSGAKIHCVVGGDELDEFKRQNELLERWSLSGVAVTTATAKGHNHFSVIEPLADADSDLIGALLEC